MNILTGLQVALQYSWIEGRYSPNERSNNGIHQFNGDNSEYNCIKQEHFTENISGQSWYWKLVLGSSSPRLKLTTGELLPRLPVQGEMYNISKTQKFFSPLYFFLCGNWCWKSISFSSPLANCAILDLFLRIISWKVSLKGRLNATCLSL